MWLLFPKLGSGVHQAFFLVRLTHECYILHATVPLKSRVCKGIGSWVVIMIHLSVGSWLNVLSGEAPGEGERCILGPGSASSSSSGHCAVRSHSGLQRTQMGEPNECLPLSYKCWVLGFFVPVQEVMKTVATYLGLLVKFVLCPEHFCSNFYNSLLISFVFFLDFSLWM